MQVQKNLNQIPPLTNLDVVADAEDARMELPENFKQKSISGAMSYTARSLLLYGIGIVTAAILSAYLSAVEFGIYGLVTQVVGLLQFVSSIGLGPALIQKHQEPEAKDYQAVFTAQQILSWVIVSLAALVIASGILADKLGTSGAWVLFALALSFPLDSWRIVPAIMLERKLDFSKLVIPNIVEQIVYNLVLLYAVVWLKAGVMSYAYAVILRGIVGVVAMWWVQPWPIGINLEAHRLRQFLGTGVKFQTADILARIKDQLFYLSLGLFLPLREFGYLTWAKSWSQMPYNLTVQNVIAITFPTYARLQNHPDLLRRAIEKTLYFIALCIFPLLVGMILFLGPLIHLVPHYQKWQPALTTFILFTISIGWAGISTPLTNTLSAIGQVNKTLKLMLMWTVLTWLLTPLLVWKLGFAGVAWAALIISFTSYIPVWYVQKVVPFNFWSTIKAPLLATAMMVVIGLIGEKIWYISFYSLFGGMIVTGLTYCLGIMLFGWSQLKRETYSLLHVRRKG